MLMQQRIVVVEGVIAKLSVCNHSQYFMDNYRILHWSKKLFLLHLHHLRNANCSAIF